MRVHCLRRTADHPSGHLTEVYGVQHWHVALWQHRHPKLHHCGQSCLGLFTRPFWSVAQLIEQPLRIIRPTVQRCVSHQLLHRRSVRVHRIHQLVEREVRWRDATHGNQRHVITLVI
jgi:hypothetical protein